MNARLWFGPMLRFLYLLVITVIVSPPSARFTPILSVNAICPCHEAAGPGLLSTGNGIPGILYIPGPFDMPGELKGKHLVGFFKRVFKLRAQAVAQLENEIGKAELNKFLKKMGIEKKCKLILSLFFLANRRYYITNNFPAGIHFKYFAKLEKYVTEHQPGGSMIIDLNNMVFHRWMNGESQIPFHYENGKYHAKNPLLKVLRMKEGAR